MGLGLDLNGPESLDPLAPQYHSHKRTKIIIIITITTTTTTTTTTPTKLNVMNHVKLLAFLSAQILVAFKIIITLDYIER